MEDNRLARIEEKLDKLADAVVSLARMEERMITLFKRMDTYERRQEDLEHRVTDVEKTSVSRGAVYRLIDKMAWLAIGGITAVIIERWFS